MILRRVMEHVKAQNWFAVAIDFVIVVVGVFIGFQVTDWAAGRASRAAEVRHLEEIAEDLRADVEMFDRILIGAKARIGSVDFLLREARGESLPRNLVLSTDTFDASGGAAVGEEDRPRLLGRVNLVRTSHGNRTGFEALIASGDLKLIRNRSISRDIQRYYAAFEDVTTTQIMLREIRNDGVAMGYALGLSAFGEIDADRLIQIVRDNEAYAAYLRTSREWAAIQRALIDEQRTDAQALLADIETYLNRHRGTAT